MNQNAVRYCAASLAIAIAAAISFATEPRKAEAGATRDPSVPAARDVLHANDGRPEGNPADMSY